MASTRSFVMTRARRATLTCGSIATDITSAASVGSIGIVEPLPSAHSPDSSYSDHVRNALIVLHSV